VLQFSSRPQPAGIIVYSYTYMRVIKFTLLINTNFVIITYRRRHRHRMLWILDI